MAAQRLTAARARTQACYLELSALVREKLSSIDPYFIKVLFPRSSFQVSSPEQSMGVRFEGVFWSRRLARPTLQL